MKVAFYGSKEVNWIHKYIAVSQEETYLRASYEEELKNIFRTLRIPAVSHIGMSPRYESRNEYVQDDNIVRPRRMSFSNLFHKIALTTSFSSSLFYDLESHLDCMRNQYIPASICKTAEMSYIP